MKGNSLLRNIKSLSLICSKDRDQPSEYGLMKRRSKRIRPIEPTNPVTVIFPGDDLRNLFGEVHDLEDLSDLYYILGENDPPSDDDIYGAAQPSDYNNSSDTEVQVPKVCCKIIPAKKRKKADFVSPVSSYQLPSFKQVVGCTNYCSYEVDSDDEEFLADINSVDTISSQNQGSRLGDNKILTASQLEVMMAVMEAEFDNRSRLHTLLIMVEPDIMMTHAISGSDSVDVLKSLLSRNAPWSKVSQLMSKLESKPSYTASPIRWSKEEILAVLPVEDAVAALKKSKDSQLSAFITERYSSRVHLHWVRRRSESKSSLLRCLHRFAWSKNSHLDTDSTPPLLYPNIRTLKDVADRLKAVTTASEKEAARKGSKKISSVSVPPADRTFNSDKKDPFRALSPSQSTGFGSYKLRSVVGSCSTRTRKSPR